MTGYRFPDFGNELSRPFPVHACCYDCAEFYDGCPAWRASKDFECHDYYRLPDVLPGTHGQIFPPPRQKASDIPAPDVAQRKSRPVGKPGELRHCVCGAVLAKGRQYCDDCRAERRRGAMREYIRRRRAG